MSPFLSLVQQCLFWLEDNLRFSRNSGLVSGLPQTSEAKSGEMRGPGIGAQTYLGLGRGLLKGLTHTWLENNRGMLMGDEEANSDSEELHAEESSPQV